MKANAKWIMMIDKESKKKNMFFDAVLLVIAAILIFIWAMTFTPPKAYGSESDKILESVGYKAVPNWTLHDSLYYDWDHAYFSIIGYKIFSPQKIRKSAFKNWWGEPVKVIELDKITIKEIKK